MTLVELRYLVALAAEGSFIRAARRCAVSQPTLSIAIARLERRLGLRLFERAKARSRKLRVTALGARVIEQAEIALREADKILDVARLSDDQSQDPLRLGVIHTVGPYLLPGLITEFKRFAPDMPLAIEENMTAALAVMLREDDIDAAILTAPVDCAGVFTRALYDEPFVVVVPRGHPWETRASIETSELLGQEVLLLKAGHYFRDQVLGACPQVSVAETGERLGYSIGTLRRMVASGLGLTVLPASAMREPYGDERLVTLPFADPKPTRRIALAWREGFTRMAAIETLIAAVRAMRHDDLSLIEDD
jgi:LysR family hydrogen peroxide-inducible transcriptional activator